jgi:choline dehydrogenase-like flavoprotein
LGIPTVAHRPHVGRNLRDHVDFVIAYESPCRDLIGFMPGDIVNAFRSAVRYHRDRRGIFSSNIAEAGGFLKTSPELHAPDIQLHLCIGILESHGRRLHAARGSPPRVRCGSSAGSLTLESRERWRRP